MAKQYSTVGAWDPSRSNEKPSMLLSNLPLLALLTPSESTDVEPHSRLERLDSFAAKLRRDLAKELQSVQSELAEAESDGRKAQLLLVAQLQRLRGDQAAAIATDTERIAPKQDSHTRLWLAAERYWNQVEQHTYPWGTRNETLLDYRCLEPTSRPDIGLSPR